jgi:RHS repeat-associated protein
MTTQLNGSLPFSAAADPDASNASGDAPKAYLTVLFFDERFNFVSEGSMAYRVQTSGNGAAPLVIPPTRAPKNGYAYVYVSNESDEMVYFDNLQVSNVHGNILEENHYYAHGLKIAAISSGKLAVATEGEVINLFLYNDKELMDDGGLDWYDYGQRNYDPQIGRFQQVDPLTDIFPAWSPFQYAGNEPVGNVDLDGMESGGLPTPGGTFMGSGILMPGGRLGGLGVAASGLSGLQIGGIALSGLNLALHGVQGGPLPPRVDLSQTDLIAYSRENKLWEQPDEHVPADDWNHGSNPTNDD